MAKNIKKEKIVTSPPPPKPVKEPKPLAQKDEVRTNIAIGTLTLLSTVLLLYILNNIILNYYTPNLQAILDKVVPLTFLDPLSFRPEPVERMQYQLSLLCSPLFVFLTYTLINKKRDLFYNNATLGYLVNLAGVGLFILYVLNLLNQNLLYVPDPDVTGAAATNSLFFKYSVSSMYGFMVIVYCLCAYLYLLYRSTEPTQVKKVIINVVSYGIASLIILDIVGYNIFHLGGNRWDRIGETNPVFYSMTQVFAGKTLLVNTNAQYGLYAWMLNPIFKVIGFSLTKFSVVMSVLNGIAFFLFYLGIKKLIKQDIISLLTFACLVYWQYWHSRFPLEDVPRGYYQYSPIRFLFPAIAFFLIVTYQSSTEKAKRYLLPILAMSVSFGVLFNVDTGLVTYGATLIALLFSTVDTSAPLKDAIKKSIPYVLWMGGCLVFAIVFMFVATKTHSGSWPDVKSFLEYQGVFYISGYFMLATAGIHFWNLPVLVYLITCIYCLYHVRKVNYPNLTAVVFVLIYGMGHFSYFQGRSYDLSITPVMYPAIILLGYLCSRFTFKMDGYKIKFHESLLIFLIPFLFLTDGVFSMMFYTPSIHSLAMKNAFTVDKLKEDSVQMRMNFVRKHVHEKDTVIILAKDFESYYYADGHYYNPVNLPGSTELFFNSQNDTLLNTIKLSKYPVIYDPTHPWITRDSILKTLAQYTVINEMLPDYSLLSLTPVKKINPRLTVEKNTIYHDILGDFRKFMQLNLKLQFHESFAIELFVTLDSANLKKDAWIFSNQSATTPFCGVFIQQNGSELNQFLFAYGNGSIWCSCPLIKLNYGVENHLVFKVDRNIITVLNNDVTVAQINTNSVIKNSDGQFYVNPFFAGRIPEIKISNN